MLSEPLEELGVADVVISLTWTLMKGALVLAGKYLMVLNDHETMVDYNYKIMIATVTNVQYATDLNDPLSIGVTKMVGDQVVGH